ncbi:hypothetical protein ACWC10_06270 [Streptomyces sp. NPDC001595]|uniref:hypothetical protein n=1 Tax=Streptomyces sp. NPDC001532 TaxID=3154520 RepID=UPI00331D410F
MTVPTGRLRACLSGDVRKIEKETNVSKRTVLALLFLVPAVLGAISLTSALTASSAVICPGENVGEDGEERPGPMRPGDQNCSVLVGNRTVAQRTYEMQWNTQSVERREKAVQGGLLIGYGALGLGCTLVLGDTARAARRS